MSKTISALLAICAITALAAAQPLPAISVDTPPAVGAVINSTVTKSGSPLTTPEKVGAPLVVVPEDYKIHVEDILRMDVWGEPQLSNFQMQVTPDGKINVPYIGDVEVKDHTQAEVTKDIAKRLEDAEIMVLPKVVITLISMHKPTVRVLGAVSRTGDFEFKEGDRVLDAVAQAGYLPDAWLENATLTHQAEQKPIAIDLRKMIDGDLTQNEGLLNGDIISIPPGPTVRVVGSVQKTGEFPFKPGDKILDAVARAGYTDTSWLEHTTLTHRGSGEPITIDVQKLLDGDLTENLPLQKDDVINIPPEEYANKFYVMGQVNRPMMYDLKENTTLLAAINLAGGPTERATLRKTIVYRADSSKPGQEPEKVKCDLGKFFDKGDRTQDIPLKPGDVVYVPETSKPNLDKISKWLSTITSLTYIRRYGLF